MSNEQKISCGFNLGQVLFPDSAVNEFTGQEIYHTVHGNKTNLGLFYMIQQALKVNGLDICKVVE